MRSKTLLLKGGMSIDSKRSRFRSAMADPELKAIHVKDEEFTYGGDDGGWEPEEYDGMGAG